MSEFCVAKLDFQNASQWSDSCIFRFDFDFQFVFDFENPRLGNPQHADGYGGGREATGAVPVCRLAAAKPLFSLLNMQETQR